MDFIKYIPPLSRLFPTSLPVSMVGYIGEKKNWINRFFNTFNFSFILKGGGKLIIEGKLFEVQAPCVFIQQPQIYMQYGPSDPYSFWEELFFVYEPHCQVILKQFNFVGLHRYIWPIKNIDKIRLILDELHAVLKNIDAPGNFERLDHLCENAILESLLGHTGSPETKDKKGIWAIRSFIEQNYLEELDFKDLARRFNISYSTFRRYWAKNIDVSPRKFLSLLRLQEACRLLAETDWSIAKIASHLRFDDPLYFSRRFKQDLGRSATDYRQDYKPDIY